MFGKGVAKAIKEDEDVATAVEFLKTTLGRIADSLERIAEAEEGRNDAGQAVEIVGIPDAKK